jgi:hypothetical protein
MPRDLPLFAQMKRDVSTAQKTQPAASCAQDHETSASTEGEKFLTKLGDFSIKTVFHEFSATAVLIMSTAKITKSRAQ